MKQDGHGPGWRAVRRSLNLCMAALSCAIVPHLAAAETMSGALAGAYRNNPALNQQRAGVRALDENVPKARAGWLPKINATGYGGPSYSYQRDAPPARTPLTQNPEAANDIATVLTFGQKYRATPRGYGVVLTQTLFDGFATLNNLRQAESQVLQGREDLRVVEQDTLMGAATSYMDVLRDIAVLALRAENVEVLRAQVGQTRSLGSVGQATVADIAQAEAALQQGRTDYYSSRSALQASMAGYRQIVGVEPRNLRPARSIETLLPARVERAVEISQLEHPAIASALHAVDSASAAVKVAESALYPTASITAAVNRDLDVQGMGGSKTFSAAILGQINVPIYQGGMEYASVRQAKEQLGQARLAVDIQRNQVRANVVTAWGQLTASKAQIRSTAAAIGAAEIALKGVRSEAVVGQRTTYDILVAQQNLLNARVAHVQAQRDRVVASYSVLAAMGLLTATELRLEPTYDPTLHFDQVKGRLFGTAAP